MLRQTTNTSEYLTRQERWRNKTIALGCVIRLGGTAGILAAALAAPTLAQDDQFSIGLGTGAARGRTDCVAAYACDHADVFGDLSGGYRFANGVEVAALAFDGGRFQGGDTTPSGTKFGGRFEIGGVGLTAGYRWAFAPRWSLLGQAGVAGVRTRFDYAAPFAGRVSETTAQPLIRVGLGYDIAPHWRVSLDLNETRFKVYTTHGSLALFGASAHYVF